MSLMADTRGLRGACGGDQPRGAGKHGGGRISLAQIFRSTLSLHRNMTRAHRKNGAICVVQQKTGTEVWIGEHESLSAERQEQSTCGCCEMEWSGVRSESTEPMLLQGRALRHPHYAWAQEHCGAHASGCGMHHHDGDPT